MARLAEAKKKPFTFLSPEEDDELSSAMARITKQLKKPSGEGKKKKTQYDPLDELLSQYTWWERNYDCAYTKAKRLETLQDALFEAEITCKPELATFDPNGFETVRDVTQAEVEECFDRLWKQTSAQVDRRRAWKEPAVSPEVRWGAMDGRQQADGGGAAAMAPEDGGCAECGGRGTLPVLPSPRTRALVRKRQLDWLSTVARPREPRGWEPTARGFTFEPALARSRAAERMRRSAKSSLPPVGPPPRRAAPRPLVIKARPRPEPEAAAAVVKKKATIPPTTTGKKTKSSSDSESEDDDSDEDEDEEENEEEGNEEEDNDEEDNGEVEGDEKGEEAEVGDKEGEGGDGEAD
mmetsp:Transcript_62025/g.140315  ORF Transcript_62025/g.140315 Transcript_62025/m.140315 type:complete len:351 (-) Transcript_62025:224-1276(-)|eukprot:CAMPEP_0172637486 /NCGR_PEP_ID=MMETSP1068-20121228/209237_1 /TAXON_ID=35684 /ORGANISM="Pseudopedinella elastica, Strain CCMP716" /LENGTH=350 /DNA_ID=CAMNT_0013450159 /DNA_START=108 /DNA_END=1160 /DNA_ORIENTATION=+